MIPRLIAILLALPFLASCATTNVTTSDGRPMPPPARQAPATPSEAKTNRILFMVGSKPDDSNGNGFPDRISATVGLFAEPHPTSHRENGILIFAIYAVGQIDRNEGKPLAEWRIEGERLERAQTMSSFGPCYQLQFSLLESGSDIYPLGMADLKCRFEPADGRSPITSSGIRRIQIGSRLAGVAE